MSISIEIPVNARPHVTANIFNAVFNTSTANRYDFSQSASNPQIVIVMKQNTVYLIERTSFSINIPEGDFQTAIDDTISVPRMFFRTKKTKQLIYPEPQPYINYVDNYELMKWKYNDQRNDEIQVSFECLLKQPPAIVGINELNAYLQLSIYEVQATDFVNNWVKPKENSGQSLDLRGLR